MKLVTVSGTFTALGQRVTLEIPNLSSEAALRLHRETATISLVMIAQDDIKSTHPRYFDIIGTDELPADFVKYIGTFPFSGVAEAHVIEVAQP